MFGFFKKKAAKPKLPNVSDKVWMNENAKWDGFINDILDTTAIPKKDIITRPKSNDILDDDFDKWAQNSADKVVCLIYYFEETKKQILDLLQQKNIAAIALDKFEINKKQGDLLVLTTAAFELEQSTILQNTLRESINVDACTFIFAEHYPLLSKEQALLETIASLSDQTLNAYFHISLDAPLMGVFGSERIKKLMVQMGAKENEVIEHPMITKSIDKAQQKIDSKIKNPKKANSAKEWFEINLPKGI